MDLYVSPHLDDVALSCAGQICGNMLGGKKSCIVSIFSQGDLQTSTLYAKRKLEDRTACKVLSADCYYLDLQDAPFRNNAYSSFSRILWGSLDGEQETIQEVYEKLCEFITHLSPAQIYAPLGVGWHIDHLITHAASRMLQLNTKAPIIYYEDRPYCFVESSVNARLIELQISKQKIGPQHDAFIQSLLTMPWMTSFHHNEDEFNFLLSRVIPWWDRLNEIHGVENKAYYKDFEIDAMDLIWESISAYTSQISTLYPDKDYFIKQALSFSAMRKSNSYLERYWLL